ncbi:hypothetical protein BCV70DRAFT_200526 [Testicularia cyperi]|uniref:GST N-terminal domain-containing protein n=1 Tax=Testicularia cyperi TaxID=1882483 RepID=A0A317XMR0_9BASI|nr:hypothetical protein BCV70DRAFT_200526 [Testicularia cyperi]
MEDVSEVKRAGSSADTEDDQSTYTATTVTTAAPSENGFDDAAVSETDSNIRVAQHEATGGSTAGNPSSAAAVATAAESTSTSTLAPALAATSIGGSRTTASSEGARFASRLDETSLSSATDGLVLFDLTNCPGGKLCFSPHTIKTILDLKLLGIGYDRQRLTFIQIRNDLASRVAENVTVPAIELADGSHIVDSWDIAEYLERRHPDGAALFGSVAGKKLAAMLNSFGKTVLAPHIAPLAMNGVHKLLDPESQTYFSNDKIGKARWNKISNLTSAEKDTHVQQAVAKLEVLNAMLEADTLAAAGAASSTSADAVADAAARSASRSRSRSSVWLAGGSQPTHADFVVFGWYVFTRAAGQRYAKDIWYAHRAVGRWVDALLEWSGDIADDFV